eukprot:2272518-Rhodomonas_salina.1
MAVCCAVCSAEMCTLRCNVQSKIGAMRCAVRRHAHCCPVSSTSPTSCGSTSPSTKAGVCRFRSAVRGSDNKPLVLHPPTK